MKSLNEYLDTNVKLADDFKQFKTKEDVCEFLENKGFEKIEFSGDYGKMLDDFEKSNTPLFYIGKDKKYNEWWVRFGKGGKNEIFFWRIPKSSEKDINYEVCDYQDKEISNFTNFKDFKKYVKKYFGW